MGKNNIIGRNVETLLKSRGWQVSDLAERMGCKTNSVYRMLNGNPRLDSIIRIANAFEISPKGLFDNDNDVLGIIKVKEKFYPINNKKDLEDVISNLSKPFNPFSMKKKG